MEASLLDEARARDSANPFISFPVRVDQSGTFDFQWVDDNGQYIRIPRRSRSPDVARAFVPALTATVFMCVAAVVLAPLVRSQTQSDLAKYTVGKVNRATCTPRRHAPMEDDDFQNPGSLWVDKGKTLWSAVDGSAGKSCQSCHNAARRRCAASAQPTPNLTPNSAV